MHLSGIFNEFDNEFEEMYFHYLPESAEDIYDNFFVTFEENKKKLAKEINRGFCCARYTFYMPFKVLLLVY